ncbi:MAG: HigA family addiction module antidote protein [Alphaproteobacteria bacterium]|nr:HigA family addiction module antidote protein [Alphaproteobacteria bacterium]
MTKLDLPTLGEVLTTEFLEPLNLSQNALAIAIGVSSNQINDIINGTKGMTADTDLRLTKYFGLTEGYFLRIQEQIELAKAKQEELL